MRRPLAPFAFALAASLAALSAQGLAKPAPAPKGPPKLIVAISVDQFSADLYAEYRPHYRQGLARLSQGVTFPSGFQSHAATETCPGHSTLLTGTHPARNGVIANTWYEPDSPRGSKPIYCAEDERDPESSAKNPVVSAWHLKVPTLGEHMKAANPQSRNVAVSAKDRAVMMMGGKTIDAAYWWKGSGFVTLKGRELSPAVVKRNAAITKVLAKGAKPLPAPAWCKPTAHEVNLGKANVGTGAFALAKGKPDQFRISPRMDLATVDLATALVDEMALGKGPAPDILSVSLSATDYIGHATGTAGLEMCIQMGVLDTAIGQLLSHLDKRKIDYMVVLSADHGGLDTPERSREQALPAAIRVDNALTPKELSKTISAKTGIVLADAPLIFGEGGDLYVNRLLKPADRARVTEALVQLLKGHPHVAAVYTSAEMAQVPMPTGSPQDWTIKERTRVSYDPVRSGDVIVLLARGVTPIPEPMPGAYIATHGSVWDYDRRVPMIFWRPGIMRFEQSMPVDTVDIAPTLAAVLGLNIPDGSFDGRCLDLDGGTGNTCAR